MPGLPVDVGIGTTITFGSSGFTAEITDVRITGFNRNAIETSHMGTTAPSTNQVGNKTFVPSKLSDPGSLAMTIHFNPNTNPPLDAVAETVTVTWPKAPADATAAYWSASGFVTSYDITAALEAVMVANLTVKFSGKISMTDAT
jgi:hypothetical protein